MENLEIGKKYSIHSYKHDGSIHRGWEEAILLDIKDDYLIQTSDILEPNNYLENLKIEDNGDFKEKNKELIKSIFELGSK